MIALIRRRFIRTDELSSLLERRGASASSRDIFVFRIRRKFELAGSPDPIETVRNWGYRLCLEPDANGSTALWIGERSCINWTPD